MPFSGSIVGVGEKNVLTDSGWVRLSPSLNWERG